MTPNDPQDGEEAFDQAIAESAKALDQVAEAALRDEELRAALNDPEHDDSW